MARISATLLKARAASAFEALGLDTGPAYADGKARPGATFLTKGPSGWDIAQICSEGGAERQLNGYCNSLSASEMLAFLDGMALGAKLAKAGEAA